MDALARIVVTISVSVTAFAMPVSGANAGQVDHLQLLPKFRDYPVGRIYRGKTEPLALDRIRRAYGKLFGDERDLRRRLSRWNVDETDKLKVDFAGNTVLAIGVCGTSCRTVTAYDAKTGMIYPLFQESHPTRWDLDNFDFPVDHSPTSKLAVFHGLLMDSANPADIFGDHYFVYRHHRFDHLVSVLMVPPTTAERRTLGKCIVYQNPLHRDLVGHNGPHTFKISIARSPLQRGGNGVPDRSGPDDFYVDVAEGYSKLTHFDVMVDGKHWNVPAEKWRDCICPNLGIWPRNGVRPDSPLLSAALSKPGDHLKVTMYGGYGSNRYKALWQLSRSGVDSRKITDFDK